MNELLKEARDTLDDELHGVHNGCLSDGLKRIAEKEALIARIDAVLAAPKYSFDSMELVLKIREKNRVYPTEYDLWPQDAARLLDDWRAVPRAMLEEISEMGDPCLNDLRKERIDTIIAKYGRAIKEHAAIVGKEKQG